MAISLNITQPTGDVASYHVATGGGYALEANSLIVEVNSFLNQSLASNGKPLCSQNVDISFVLSQPAPTPPAGSTVNQIMQSIVETALISQQTTVNGTTQNGVFYGGTIVD